MKLLNDTRPKARQGRARRGEGSLRLKNGIYYYRVADPARPGKQIEASCGTSDYQAALVIKNEAIRKLALPAAQRIALETAGCSTGEVLEDYANYILKNAEHRAAADPDFDMGQAQNRIRLIERLIEYFGKIPANEMTTAITDEYRKKREAQVAFTTVNNELTHLRAAFNRARQTTPPKVTIPLKIWFRPDDSQVREGFVDREQYREIIGFLPDSLKAAFVCAFHTRTRVGELKKIRWAMVNFEKGIIEIRAKTAKTRTGRWIPIWGDMKEFLEWQKSVRDRECPETEWVFFKHLVDCRGSRAVPGSALGSTNRQWRAAMKAAGLSDLLFHDLRRSAIKYADQEAGINPAIVRLMSGHKTESVYQRYNIRGAREIEKLGATLDEHLQKKGKGSGDLHLVPLKESA